MRHWIYTAGLLLFLWGSAALADDSNTGRWSVEIDPGPFALNGYALHFRYEPVSLPHWVFGVGTYGLDFPNALVEMNGQNRDEAWESRLTNGTGLFFERYFSAEREGWFAGLQISRQAYRIQKSNSYEQDLLLNTVLHSQESSYNDDLYNLYLWRKDEIDLLLLQNLFQSSGNPVLWSAVYTESHKAARFANGLAMVYGGYRYFPGQQDSLYFLFWGGLGYTGIVEGKPELRGSRYDVAGLVPFLTVHVGYRF